MMSAKDMVKVMIVMFAICFFAKSDGNPIKGKTVGDAQLLSNVRQLLQNKDGQELVQKLLHELNVFDSTAPKGKGSARSRRKEDNVLYERHQKSLAEADKAYLDVLTKAKSQ
ncbi:parathyroid hormone [Eptesicus fuscus]|uniref:parathyroid hormone n=1 Tax=Eptesicus fuscus TaxID=29078 RepID=UPI00046BE4F2|nr:parathyroid hormone [Eptesicus fuscus]